MILRDTRCALALAALGLFAAPAAAEEALDSERDRTLYSLGAYIGLSMRPYSLTASELEVFYQGMRDQITGAELALDIAEYQPQIRALQDERRVAAAAREAAAAKVYLDAVAAEEGVVRLESGLLYDELEAGDGDSPMATSTVRVHYRGTLRDGTEFDSSCSRGQPSEFPLNRVIACWTEGLQQMKVGGKARLVCPGEIGYGPNGSPPNIPGNAVLSFEIELLSVTP